ncbi:MAG TPA: response regulator transcription factor [Bryobacteraceae bacterium]|jgi:two-component system response regulator NreC|nr:response regulator transcription factor [Bryobacteraceae bacterium]
MAFRVVLVDDHQVLRDAIKEILVRHPEFEVVGEAGSGPDAIDACRRNEPDLVVMDIGLPGINGIEATGELARHCPRVRVLMLSMFDDEDSVMAAVRSGARGFVLKKACATELVDAMRTVVRGGTYFSAQVSDRLLSGVQSGKTRPQAHPGRDSLSPREQQVLRLTADGKSNKEVATLLHLEVHTVRSYRKSLMAKLGASNVAQLIQVAVAAGLIDTAGTKPAGGPGEPSQPGD